MPDKTTFRVQADRSFRLATPDGITIVHPGDVVDVNRDTYFALVAAVRAHLVGDETPLRRGQGYMPAYKRERLGRNKPAAAQNA